MILPDDLRFPHLNGGSRRERGYQTGVLKREDRINRVCRSGKLLTYYQKGGMKREVLPRTNEKGVYKREIM